MIEIGENMSHQIKKTSDIKYFIKHEQMKLDKIVRFLKDSEHMLKLHETEIRRILSEHGISVESINHKIINNLNNEIHSLVSIIVLLNPMDDDDYNEIYEEFDQIGIPVFQLVNESFYNIQIGVYK